MARKKKVGYPPLPGTKPGVKRKLFGGKEARRARRAERQEDRQERRDARKEARAQAKEEGVGFFGRMRAGFQAGREVREQQRLEDQGLPPEELEETAPEMTGAVGGGVDTSAAGAGMDSGGNIAAQRGGVIDRRRRRRAYKQARKRRVPPGDMPDPFARYESNREKPRYKVKKKGLRTRKSVIRKSKRR